MHRPLKKLHLLGYVSEQGMLSAVHALRQNAPRDFPPRKDGILYPPVGLSWDSPPPPAESVRTDGRTYGRSRDYYVTTKISRIDRLPNLLGNGAPLADFARRLRY